VDINDANVPFPIGLFWNQHSSEILKQLTKNRREMDRENISGHMPEDREMPEYCPVRNFETYLQKLHPQCNRLWQFPKDSFNISDECWFQKRPIGKGTLASFMDPPAYAQKCFLCPFPYDF
jgi:hypothetical protein